MLTEQCYGIVVVYKENNENLFLLLRQFDEPISKGSWTFPKGHQELGENSIDTALRELYEETKIKDIDILDAPLIYEEYEINKENEKRLKINEYFIGFVKNKDVTIEESEISEYKWLSYKEAIDTLTYSTRKEVLRQALEALKKMLS